MLKHCCLAKHFSVWPPCFVLFKHVSTRRWTDKETDILIDMFEESACLWDIFSKDYHMKDKRDKAYEKIQEELDIPITEIKNKIIGLRSQLSREVA